MKMDWKNLQITLIVVLVIAAIGLVAWQMTQSTGSTQSIKSTNLSSSSSDREVMLFTASWCGHSKRFQPTWQKLQQTVSGAKFTTIDIDQDKATAKKYGVSAMPTIIMKKGNKLFKYSGDRSYQSMVNFIQSN